MLRYVDYDIVFQEIPDEVTLAINLSNIPNSCKGCHSPHLLENVGESLTEESLGHLLQKYGKAVTCVCFMGGDAEPFEVERLAGFLHRQSIALVKVGWYSGKNELPEGLSVQNFEYIKLGPYIEIPPFSDKYIKLVMLPVDSLHHSPMHCRHSSFHINGLPKFGESQDNCQGLSYYIRL